MIAAQAHIYVCLNMALLSLDYGSIPLLYYYVEDIFMWKYPSTAGDYIPSLKQNTAQQNKIKHNSEHVALPAIPIMQVCFTALLVCWKDRSWAQYFFSLCSLFVIRVYVLHALYITNSCMMKIQGKPLSK